MILKVILIMLMLTGLISIGILWFLNMDKTYFRQLIKTVMFLLSCSVISVSLLWLLVLLF